MSSLLRYVMHSFHRSIHRSIRKKLLRFPDYSQFCNHYTFFRMHTGQFLSTQALQGFSKNGLGCIGIQPHICRISGKVLIVCLGTDHGAVVTAEA